MKRTKKELILGVRTHTHLYTHTHTQKCVDNKLGRKIFSLITEIL